MKFATLLLTIFLLSFFELQIVCSQNSKKTHSFKITGSTRVPMYSPVEGEMTVEYDSTSTDHLYITEYKKNGFLKTKTRLLFKGGKFNLENLNDYIQKGEILVDGTQTEYREDETVASEILYKKEGFPQQTLFYPNGKKQLSFSGDGERLTGEYKMWSADGQLIYSGNYKNNLKDGEFQQFDQSGKLVKEGVYQSGKLVSGEAVVQDLIYENPDKPAQYIGGNNAFYEYLKNKSSELKAIKMTATGDVRIINLDLYIDKTGSIWKSMITSTKQPFDQEIINAAFDKFPLFMPAVVEGVPVKSKLSLNLLLTDQGLELKYEPEHSPISEKSDSLKGPAYFIVEEMPEFHGGQLALRKFVAMAVRYPVEAQERGIQGKVFVNFVVEADGSISNIKVAKSVHPLLDAEAVRVVQDMPRWRPGRQSGKPVRVAYTVPINFSLQ